jgi:23S rRNA (guanine745-N1)-methyltransferase
VYLNRPVVEENENFKKESFLKLQYKFTLNNQTEIDELFKMTPYYYKTSAEAQNRLLSMNSMSITASFGIIKYRRL